MKKVSCHISPWERVKKELRGEAAGHLATVLVVKRREKVVSCYGHRIEEGDLFRTLNLNTDWTVRHCQIRELPNIRRGFFVLWQDFGPHQRDKTDWFIALTGIDWDSEESPVPFKIN